MYIAQTRQLLTKVAAEPNEVRRSLIILENIRKKEDVNLFLNKNNR